MFPETFMDYIILSYIIQYTMLGIWLAKTIHDEIQPKAIILRKQKETNYRIATLNLKREWDVFFFDKKAYLIDWKKVAYHTICYWHHVPRLFYYENEGSPLTIFEKLLKNKLGDTTPAEKTIAKKIKENAQNPIDPEKNYEKSPITEPMMRKLYMVAKEKCIQQLAKASTSFMVNNYMTILLILLAIGCGFAFGWISCTYLAPQQIVNATTSGG